MPTLGRAFYDELGMNVTRWIPWDGEQNQRLMGTFDPAKATAQERYGNADGRAKGWPSEQRVGGHATGHAVNGVRLAAEVFGRMGIKVDLGAPGTTQALQDEADMNYLVGATSWAIAQGLKLGIIQPIVPPGEKPLPGGGEALEILAKKVQELAGRVDGAEKGLLAGRGRLEKLEATGSGVAFSIERLGEETTSLRQRDLDLEAKVSEVATALTGGLVALEDLKRRVAALEGKPTKPPVTPPGEPDPTEPLASKALVFHAPDFTVTEAEPVLHGSWSVPKGRKFKRVTLSMRVEITERYATEKGQKENLFWLVAGSNRNMIGYALLTKNELVVSEGIGMKAEQKERQTTKGLEPGTHDLFYEWNEGGTWRIKAGPRQLSGPATGILDFAKGSLMLDIGFPGAADSVELATPGWKFTDIVVILED